MEMEIKLQKYRRIENIVAHQNNMIGRELLMDRIKARSVI
jgi:hypothetical protein